MRGMGARYGPWRAYARETTLVCQVQFFQNVILNTAGGYHHPRWRLRVVITTHVTYSMGGYRYPEGGGDENPSQALGS